MTPAVTGRLPPLFQRQSEQFVYTQAPKLVYWEATQSCALACLHCRAEAIPQRSPLELTTDDAQALLRQIADFGGDPLPHLVITGGDPLQRPDLYELIAYGRGLGLSVSITPAGTAALTAAVIDHLHAAGISSIALSLDGSTPALHDAFRGVAGLFAWTEAGAQAVMAHGIVFISHAGQVFPSGFLPISAGSVRTAALAGIYRDSALFRALRDADQLQGKCGICAYRTLCGGSRARAYAATGDPLASDPLCPYQPRAAL